MATKGERIKKYREELGLSQVFLADKIGVSKQTLYKYENDIITNIPSDKIEALAKVFNCTPAYLMGWVPDTPDGICDYYDDSIDEAANILQSDGFSIKYENISYEPFIIIESSDHTVLLAIYEGNFLSSYEHLKLRKEIVYSKDIIKAISKLPLPDESGLLSDFRKLNDIGKGKAREYIEDLTGNDRYIDNGEKSSLSDAG